MRISIDDYAYVYIKLASVKPLLMNEQEISKISSFSDLDSFSTFLNRFFPGFQPREKTVLSFERELWRIYFKIIEKILLASPETIQHFLKNLMVRYEIWNLKVILLDIIAGVPSERREYQIYRKPAELLERNEFLNRLLTAKKIEDFEKAVLKTPYEKIVKFGLQKYKETAEIFFLEHALDKYYYDNLIRSTEFLPSNEKPFIEQFIRTSLDYYNLNLLFRAIYNNVPLKLIKDYLISSGYLIRIKEIRILIESENLNDFFNKLRQILAPHKKYQFIADDLEKMNPDDWIHLKDFLIRDFMARYQKDIIADIPLTSISNIFKIVLQKENEINEVLTRAVQITIAAHKM